MYEVELLKKMVAIPSVTGDENAMADFIACELDNYSEIRIEEVHGRKNVIAKKGSGKILLLGHMDTVPLGENWIHAQGQISGTRLYGRGSTDMKSGLAAMMAAFRNTECDAILAATVGEETDGCGSNEFNKTHKCEFGIVAEPTSLNLVIAEKGIIDFHLTTRGTSAHSSRPWEGENAIHTMAEAIRKISQMQFEPRNDLLGSSTIQVTIVEGGVAHNVIPDKCVATVNMRLIPEDAHLFEYVRSELSEYEIEKFHERPPYSIERNNKYVQMLHRISGGVFCGMHGATDASLIDTPCVIFGPGDLSLAHKIDEYVELSEVTRATSIFSEFLGKARDL
jgi:succinyl-diaminopimelate desuccinylase